MCADGQVQTEAEATPSEIVAGLDLAAKVRSLSGAGFWSLEPRTRCVAVHSLTANFHTV